MGNWRDKAACRDMDPDLFFPATRKEESLLHMPGDTRMRTVRGGTCPDKRLPAARHMGRDKQKQKKESK